MEQRVSLITLAVGDMAAAAAFYEALGWQRVETPDGLVAFDLLGQVLGLYPREKLAEDIGVPVADVRGSGLTLSYNVRQKGEVALIYETALAAGAQGLKPPHDIFWGGYVAYFRDLDGHIWEIAFNPFSPLAPNGAFQWNGCQEEPEGG